MAWWARGSTLPGHKARHGTRTCCKGPDSRERRVYKGLAWNITITGERYMGIEWAKVQGKQDKEFKVKGTILLEMKARIETLEKEVASLNGKIEGMKMTVETTTGEKDKNIKNLVDEKNKLQSSLEGTITSLEGKINQLELKNRELTSALDAAKEEARKQAAEATDAKKQHDILKKELETMELELQARDFNAFKKYIKEKSERASKTFEQKPAP